VKFADAGEGTPAAKAGLKARDILWNSTAKPSGISTISPHLRSRAKKSGDEAFHQAIPA
jgi:hypothetical protein